MKKKTVSMIMLAPLLIGLLTLAFEIHLAYAQPIDIGKTLQPVPFESNPTAYANDGMNPGSTALMMDGALLTSGYIYITGTTSTAYFELSTFTTPTTSEFQPGWVEIKMKYETPGTTNDLYRIEYSTDGTTWIDLQPDVSGTDSAFTAAIRPWTQLTEPTDGMWTWSDIASLRVRFYCTRMPPGPFPPGVWDNSPISVYEVWATIYPLPLPPASPTTVSVQPPAVMSVGPYDPMLAPTGPQGYCFVEIYVNEVADMFCYEITLEFDTRVLTPISAWSYYPWNNRYREEFDDVAGQVYMAYGMVPPVPVGAGFTGSSPCARIYFMVDQYGGAGATTDIEFKKPYPYSFLGDTKGFLIPADFYDGWFSGPRYMSYQGSLYPGGDPAGTQWHELYPQHCNYYTVTDWNDTNADGDLNPSDHIEMQNETESTTKWYHVDDVTTTIHWTFKTGEGGDLTEELGAAEPYVPVDWPMGDPTGTYWHQIYGPPPPGSGPDTPGYCRWFQITSWEDTDLSYTFNPSDQFDFQYFDEPGVTYWAHLDDVTTDIVVSEEPGPVIDDLPPIIRSVSRTPSIPNYDEDVEVTATITDNVEVDGALLSYTYDMTWYNASMNREGDKFNSTIPTQPYGTLVKYMTYANDTNGNWAVSDVYAYTVIDKISPEIQFVQCTPLLNISANITEPTAASGVDTVLLYLKLDNGDWWNTALTYDSALGLWTRTIFGYNQLAGKTIEYFIEAYDNAGNKNTSEVLNHSVEEWRVADLNRDNKVDRVDLLLLVTYLRHGAPLIGFAGLLIGSIVYVKRRKRKQA